MDAIVLTRVFFFFNDTATTEIYTLSLHDALPISALAHPLRWPGRRQIRPPRPAERQDRKSTRLNSSHGPISYAVFCLKKKTNTHSGSRTTHKNFDQHSQRLRLGH